MLDVEGLKIIADRRPLVEKYLSEFRRSQNASTIAVEIIGLPDAMRAQIIDEWPNDIIEILWEIYCRFRDDKALIGVAELCKNRFEFSAPSHIEDVKYEWERLGRQRVIESWLKWGPIRPCRCGTTVNKFIIRGNSRMPTERRLLCADCFAVVWEQIIRW